MTNCVSPWYNRNGWLDVKHQIITCTYLNVLAVRRYSRNSRVKTKGKLDVFSLAAAGELSVFVISGLSFTSIQAPGAQWLADAVYPFGIYDAVFGTDRLNPMLWAVLTVRLCWNTIGLWSCSDGSPKKYGRKVSGVSALRKTTVSDVWTVFICRYQLTFDNYFMWLGAGFQARIYWWTITAVKEIVFPLISSEH